MSDDKSLLSLIDKFYECKIEKKHWDEQVDKTQKALISAMDDEGIQNYEDDQGYKFAVVRGEKVKYDFDSIREELDDDTIMDVFSVMVDITQLSWSNYQKIKGLCEKKGIKLNYAVIPKDFEAAVLEGNIPQKLVKDHSEVVPVAPYVRITEP